MLRRAVIHALVAPVVANVLLLAVAFVDTVLRKPGMFDQHVAQAAELLPKLLTAAYCVLFLGWALLAVIGMAVADTRKPRSVIGIIRLGLGGALVGGPGVLAILILGLLGVPVWMVICAMTLAACRWMSGAFGAGSDDATGVSRRSLDPVPDSRAVFGRRGLV
jgi:hypothetical protein